MFATENTFRSAITLIRNLNLLVLLLVCMPCLVVAQGTAGLAEGNGTNARPHSAIESLANIQLSLEAKRTTARELREQLKQQEDVSEKQTLEQKIERINKDITSLQLAFENIALGNPDLSVLTDEPE